MIAVGKPQPRLIDPAGVDASQGFELFYVGEAPTKSDPYTCDVRTSRNRLNTISPNLTLLPSPHSAV